MQIFTNLELYISILTFGEFLETDTLLYIKLSYRD